MEKQQYTWEVVEKKGRPMGIESFLTVRTNSIKLRMKAYRDIQIKERGYAFVMVKRDMQKMALLLQFLTRAEFERLQFNYSLLDCMYELMPDGGSRPSGRDERPRTCINCGNVISKTPWLFSLLKEGVSRRRRFQLQPQQAKNEFVVEILPGFANECDPMTGVIPARVKGIYCYYSATGEILYVGQGIIARRYAQHKKQKDIPAKFLRWTEIDDDKARKLAEAHHLRAYFDRHGQLPPFNVCRPELKS